MGINFLHINVTALLSNLPCVQLLWCAWHAYVALVQCATIRIHCDSNQPPCPVLASKKMLQQNTSSLNIYVLLWHN